jgi:hypothetical protein
VRTSEQSMSLLEKGSSVGGLVGVNFALDCARQCDLTHTRRRHHLDEALGQA